MDRLKEIIGNNKWQLAFFSLTHVVVLPLLFNTVYLAQFSSIGIYYDYSSAVMGGSLPYHDFLVEYPPFSLFFFMLPRLFTDNTVIYEIIFQAEVFLFDLLGIFLIYRIAQRTGKVPWKMLAAYTIAILAVGPIITRQYDIFPAIMILLSLYCFWVGRHKTSWFILALATMTKIYPAVIAPLLLLHYIRNRQFKRIWSGILLFSATCLVTAIPFIAAAPDCLLSFINYHTERGVQLESTYCSFMLIADKLGWTSTELAYSAGSWNLARPLANTLATISTYVLLAILLMSYWFIYSRLKHGFTRFADMGTSALLIIAVTLVGSKILSPQYLIWLIPLLPMAVGARYCIWSVFVVIGALSYYIFPLHYTNLLYFETAPVVILLVRNILLILLVALAGISLYRSRTHPQPLRLN